MGKQKRSENTYQKINTVFKRDKYGIIMPYEPLVMPELEWLRGCKFDASEKIDGTNCRIEVTRTDILSDLDNVVGIKWSIAYRGKTDNAHMPKMLGKFFEETYPLEKVLPALGLREEMRVTDDDVKEKGWSVESTQFPGVYNFDFSKIPTKYTIYGEGYGVKIQSCGGSYLKDSNSFIGFDVKVDDSYLLWDNAKTIFQAMGCPTVPEMGQMTIDEAIEFVKKGFISNISENREFMAEGLVLKSPCGVTTRRGERIIFKVKTCDWQKYFAKYGTYDQVEQEPNEHY